MRRTNGTGIRRLCSFGGSSVIKCLVFFLLLQALTALIGIYVLQIPNPFHHNSPTSSKKSDVISSTHKPKVSNQLNALSSLLSGRNQETLTKDESLEGDTKKPRDLSTSCKKRANRRNPKSSGERGCPIDVHYRSEGDLDLSTIDDVAELGLLSTRNCTSEDHCEYKNVCLLPGQQRFMWLSPVKSGKMKLPDDLRYKIGFYIYKEGEAKRRSLSWNYEFLKDSNYVAPTSVRWLDGTTIWYDQSYNEPCHQGHASEFYSKLVDLRKQFPGKVDRILYNNKQSGDICGRTCHLMMLGFEQEGWVVPPIFSIPVTTALKSGAQPVCFDRLLVPSNTQQHFTSREAANEHRDAALRLCDVPKRYPTKNDTKKLFFYERGFDRYIVNSEELCEHSNTRGFTAVVDTDDQDFCTQVESIYSADVIVTTDGSQNQILSYARPGSVVIFAYPFHFRVPDWKLLAYYASLRSLEIVTLDKENARGHNVDFYASKTIRDCYGWACRSGIKSLNLAVPQPTLDMFLDRALDIWNKTDEVDECEKPLVWPIPFEDGQDIPKGKDFGIYSAYGYANNWLVCEPPEPNCLCCKDPNCQDAVHLERGF